MVTWPLHQFDIYEEDSEAFEVLLGSYGLRWIPESSSSFQPSFPLKVQRNTHAGLYCHQWKSFQAPGFHVPACLENKWISVKCSLDCLDRLLWYLVEPFRIRGSGRTVVYKRLVKVKAHIQLLYLATINKKKKLYSVYIPCFATFFYVCIVCDMLTELGGCASDPSITFEVGLHAIVCCLDGCSTVKNYFLIIFTSRLGWGWIVDILIIVTSDFEIIQFFVYDQQT